MLLYLQCFWFFDVLTLNSTLFLNAKGRRTETVWQLMVHPLYLNENHTSASLKMVMPSMPVQCAFQFAGSPSCSEWL